jgi:hypothetical protein
LSQRESNLIDGEVAPTAVEQSLERIAQASEESIDELENLEQSGLDSDSTEQGKSAPSDFPPAETAPNPAQSVNQIGRSASTYAAMWPSQRGAIVSEPVDNGSAGCPAGLSKLLGSNWPDSFASYWAYTCVVGFGGDDVLGLANSASDSYLLGNGGNDDLSLDYYVARTVVAGGAGYDLINGSDLNDTIFGQESADDIYGWWGSDFLSGGGGNDYIVGGRDHDELVGGLGDDTLVGGSESDWLKGEEGSDLLVGDCSTCIAGNDLLEGGSGNDEVWGGAGNDTLIGGSDLDFIDAGSGDDTVLIADVCEIVAGESYAGGSGIDTLVTPLSVSALQALGVSVSGFENVRVEKHPCAAQCLPASACSGHGACVELNHSGAFTCECDWPYFGENCSEISDLPARCSEVEDWRNLVGAPIAAGKRVFRGDSIYECKSGAASGFCGNVGYDPLGTSGASAWNEIAPCLRGEAGCGDAIAPYNSSMNYPPGQVVMGMDEKVYRCRPWPQSGWCSNAAYAPGVGANWNDAWEQIDDCSGSEDLLEPPPDPVVDDEELTSAELVTDTYDDLVAEYGPIVWDWIAAGKWGEDEVVAAGEGYLVTFDSYEYVVYSIAQDGTIRFDGDQAMEPAAFWNQFYATETEAKAAVDAYLRAISDELNQPMSGYGLFRIHWDGLVPRNVAYFIEDLDEKFAAKEVRWAFDYWSKYTEINFDRVDTLVQCTNSEYCIIFRSISDGCHTEPFDVDFPTIRTIRVNKKSKLCRGAKRWKDRWVHGAMLHEIGHALNLQHEQKRYDREEYVHVVWPNIQDDKETRDQFRIDHSAIAYGLYDKKSTMHYPRRAWTRNGLVTIEGAPRWRKAGDGSNILTNGDIISAVVARDPRRIWMNANPDFRGDWESFGAGPEDQWRTYRASHGDFDDLDNAEIRAIAIPPQVRVLGTGNETHDTGASQLFRAFKPYFEEDFDDDLRRDVARLLVRPAAHIFSRKALNGTQYNVEFGEPKSNYALPFAFIDVSEISYAVGAGLWLEVCAETESGLRCHEVSTRVDRTMDLEGRLRSVEARPAVTLFRNEFFETPHIADSLSLPISDGPTTVGYGDIRLGAMDGDASAVFVAPGVRANLCRTESFTLCEIYEAGPHRLTGAWNDAISSLQVTPAVTLFENALFNFSGGYMTVAPGEIVRALNGRLGTIAENEVSSLILAPFVRVTICVDSRGPSVPDAQCISYSGGRTGREVTQLPEGFNNEASYVEVSYE